MPVWDWPPSVTDTCDTRASHCPTGATMAATGIVGRMTTRQQDPDAQTVELVFSVLDLLIRADPEVSAHELWMAGHAIFDADPED